jgi:hypothetical protein
MLLPMALREGWTKDNTRHITPIKPPLMAIHDTIHGIKHSVLTIATTRWKVGAVMVVYIVEEVSDSALSGTLSRRKKKS